MLSSVLTSEKAFSRKESKKKRDESKELEDIDRHEDESTGRRPPLQIVKWLGIIGMIMFGVVVLVVNIVQASYHLNIPGSHMIWIAVIIGVLILALIIISQQSSVKDRLKKRQQLKITPRYDKKYDEVFNKDGSTAKDLGNDQQVIASARTVGVYPPHVLGKETATLALILPLLNSKESIKTVIEAFMRPYAAQIEKLHKEKKKGESTEGEESPETPKPDKKKVDEEEAKKERIERLKGMKWFNVVYAEVKKNPGNILEDEKGELVGEDFFADWLLKQRPLPLVDYIQRFSSPRYVKNKSTGHIIVMREWIFTLHGLYQDLIGGSDITLIKDDVTTEVHDADEIEAVNFALIDQSTDVKEKDDVKYEEKIGVFNILSCRGYREDGLALRADIHADAEYTKILTDLVFSEKREVIDAQVNARETKATLEAMRKEYIKEITMLEGLVSGEKRISDNQGSSWGLSIPEKAKNLVWVVFALGLVAVYFIGRFG
jgi:hypothetical protein